MAKGCWLFLSILFVVSGCGSHQETINISALDHFKRGNTYFEENRFQAAAAEYKAAIAQDPDQERFYYNLGLVYYSLVLYDKAIQEYWRAIERNPKFAEVWYNLALALEKTGQTEKAVMAYQKYQTLSQINEQQTRESAKPQVTSQPNSKSEQSVGTAR